MVKFYFFILCIVLYQSIFSNDIPLLDKSNHEKEVIEKIMYDIRYLMFKKLQKGRISKEQCLNLRSGPEGAGFEREMGPESNQGIIGWCWAHASAKLLEQQLCKSNPALCGQKVSVPYLASTQFGQGKNHQGRFASERLEEILSSGSVCLDRYARNPYEISKVDLIDILSDFYTTAKGNVSFDELWVQYRLLFEEIDFFILNYKELGVGKNLNINTVDTLVRSSSSVNEFLKNVLLFNCNDKTNVKMNVDNLRVVTKYQQGNPLNFNIIEESIIDALKSENAVEADICFLDLIKMFLPADDLGAYFPDGMESSCAPHSIVLSNFRWNEDKQRCDVYLINSHGEKTGLPTTWYPAEPIFSNVIRMSYFK